LREIDEPGLDDPEARTKEFCAKAEFPKDTNIRIKAAGMRRNFCNNSKA
jgi:hypothetical protein